MNSYCFRANDTRCGIWFPSSVANLGPNSHMILGLSSDSFWTYGNLMTTGEFTEHLRQF